MRSDQNLLNETGFITDNFIRENPTVAIPYLTLLCIFTLSGCIGNTMVIGAVLTHKVHCFFNLFRFDIYVQIAFDNLSHHIEI